MSTDRAPVRAGLARAALVVLGVSWFASQRAAWGAGIDERAREYLLAVDAALAAGDLAGAERSLEMAWVYASSRLFSTIDRSDEWRAAARKVAAARLAPDATRRRDEAAALLATARDARRPDASTFDRVVAVAAACERAIAEGGDVDLELRAGAAPTLGEIQADCRSITDAALAGRAEAERFARERDAALRALLAGDRLAIYRERGEPSEPAGATPAEIARAKTWIYVVGPTGALRTYERWTFTFSGNRVVSRRRTTSHEQP